MAKYENVTGWSASRRHRAESGSHYALCMNYPIVRAGSNLHSGGGKKGITQKRIDAMPICKRCQFMEALHERDEALVKRVAELESDKNVLIGQLKESRRHVAELKAQRNDSSESA